MDFTARDQISQHPTNRVNSPDYITYTDKPWARICAPIQNILVHTAIGADGKTSANFEAAFLPWCDDDRLRLDEYAVPPSRRTWRLETEADCELWFHTEISNVLLAAWSRYPEVMQTSHTKPPRVESIPEEVGSTHSVKFGGVRTVLAIGEMKRNLIDVRAWQRGDISNKSAQKELSQELRGYADKYQCPPQVFCFDGSALLLLQFRAINAEDIREPDCAVDCWVLPRASSNIPLRYALYVLLAQGFRRYQGACAAQALSVGGLTPRFRLFYNGLPVWRAEDRNLLEHPGGYQRSVDANSGAVKWTHPENPDEVVWETPPFWSVQAV
ncbi:hypothetical protein VTK26DRAFT_3346 [Humicola hyalothermophila]